LTSSPAEGAGVLLLITIVRPLIRNWLALTPSILPEVVIRPAVGAVGEFDSGWP